MVQRRNKDDILLDEDTQNLFRGIPDYPNARAGEIISLDTSMIAKASEYFIVSIASIVGLWLLYWLGKTFNKNRKSKREVKNILNINQTYKELVEREASLLGDLTSVTEQLNSV